MSQFINSCFLLDNLTFFLTSFQQSDCWKSLSWWEFPRQISKNFLHLLPTQIHYTSFCYKLIYKFVIFVSFLHIFVMLVRFRPGASGALGCFQCRFSPLDEAGGSGGTYTTLRAVSSLFSPLSPASPPKCSTLQPSMPLVWGSSQSSLFQVWKTLHSTIGNVICSCAVNIPPRATCCLHLPAQRGLKPD